MPFLDKLYIQKYHENKMKKHGSGKAESLGWFTEESQLKRFEVLAQIGNLNHASVWDIGCGNGDIYTFLSQKFSGIEYHGIDFIEDFLENAIERNKKFSAAHFYLGDFMSGELRRTDYVFASGSLNYRNSNPDFIYKAISKLYDTCTVALGFNLLSKPQIANGILVEYDPQEIIQFCETLSEKIILKEGYDDGDFTVMMYR